MDDILRIYDDILKKNELDVIDFLKSLKCPCKIYLKAIEFINYHRQQNEFTRTLFIYIDCVANNYHLKLLTDIELDYLYNNVSYDEYKSYKIYNTLVNPNFVKNIINNTWLDMIMSYDELFNTYMTPYTNISTILSTIMKYYSHIRDINKRLLIDNKLINFNNNEYLITDKKQMYQFINYIENITQSKLTIYIKSFLYNYQFNNPIFNPSSNSNSSPSSSYNNNSNSNSNSSPSTSYNNSNSSPSTSPSSSCINDINYLKDENDIEFEYDNIYVSSSRFKLNIPFEMVILSNLSNECYNKYIMNKTFNYNKLNLYEFYLNNGLIYLGNCYESMNIYTHFLYDTKIDRFILFNINGEDNYDISNNDNEILLYVKKNRSGRFESLHNYFSMYQNENILYSILNNEYKSYLSSDGKFKNSLNYI